MILSERMSNYSGFHKISHKDAFATIGLHDKNELTFFLANMILEIEGEGLKITYLNSSRSAAPDQTMSVSGVFKYVNNNINYLIVNEDGKIVIYEEDQIIGS